MDLWEDAVMKTLTVAIGLLLTGSAWGGPELLVQYQFDGMTALVPDLSGNGSDAYYQMQGVGELAPAAAPGVSGRADDYAYNGSSADAMGNVSRGLMAYRVLYSGNGLDAGYESFTVCGWFKTEGAVSFSANARIVTMVGTENVSLFDSLGNGLRFQVGEKFVESGGDAYTTAGEWTFFAVTYDGTIGDGDNVQFWEGTKDVLTLVRSTKIDKDGAWRGLGPAGIISIGNRHGSVQGKHMNRPLDGYMDDFRIYVSEKNGDGVLSETELNEIRKSALD